jgi:hypothetical protein
MQGFVHRDRGRAFTIGKIECCGRTLCNAHHWTVEGVTAQEELFHPKLACSYCCVEHKSRADPAIPPQLLG